MSAVIVTLSRFPDVFAGLADSVSKHEPRAVRVLVTSGDLWVGDPIDDRRWLTVKGAEPFVFARNANMGMGETGRSDVLLINDDCRLIMPVLADLYEASVSNPQVGLFAPQVRGGVGSEAQRERRGKRGKLRLSQERLAFVCVYIPRRTLDLIGPLDENFDGYGGDDVDYCHRVKAAGLRLAVVEGLVVEHGRPGDRGGYSASFSRVMTALEQSESMKRMDKMFKAKHGLR